ncbi:Ig-like domain-containing protein, partial [Flavobacterium sp. CSZ]|uniref:beta strand repeat-containing protein n=1 Tax=Flavobacterium sp. CSZ TaxID=2783791 RepID=UPI00188AAF99
MKVFHKSIYILLCLFSVTVLFSQNNEKNSYGSNLGKRNPVGAIIGGDDNICAGSQTQFSVSNLSNHAGHSGNWSVSNKLVATVSNNGLVRALRAGIFILKYDSDDSNCKGGSYRTIVVNSVPSASVTGPTSICINGITTLFPIIGGTWSSNNPAVATVNNLGVVKGISAGSATFTFTRLGGCSSEATSPIVVNATAKAEVVGQSIICINETTTLSPNSGGTWSSSNNTVATVSNAGIVKGISSGSATFTFTKTGGCASLPTPAVKVNPNTAVSITGANVICINGTTTLSPTSGGIWSSTNTSIATVNNAGIVQGKAAGKVTFIFTKTDGCASWPTSAITVNDCPVASITGPSLICVSGTTTLSPKTGGTWSSSNRAVATVSNSGIVTGISPGLVSFTYTKTGSCSSIATQAITVSSITPVRITGSTVICINGTTTLSPTTGGTWSSNNTAVATVSNEGIVKAVSQGKATFVYTKTGGCASPATSPITVNDCPVASITGPNSICVNATTTLSPTTGGIWTSSNKAVATVTNSGVVKGISSGTAKFTFTKTGSCNSLASPVVTVSANTAVSITGANSICINGTTTLSPTTGGTWASNNAAVATVSNQGIVTGISSGTATFIFTSTTGCVSAPTSAITINANPIVSAITGGSSIISIGSTTQFYNNTSGGVWSITNGTGSATITASGLVTGTGIGTVKIDYTVKNGYCKSEMVSHEITVK